MIVFVTVFVILFVLPSLPTEARACERIVLILFFCCEPQSNSNAPPYIRLQRILLQYNLFKFNIIFFIFQSNSADPRFRQQFGSIIYWLKKIMLFAIPQCFSFVTFNPIYLSHPSFSHFKHLPRGFLMDNWSGVPK